MRDQRFELRNQIQSLWSKLEKVENAFWAGAYEVMKRYAATQGASDHHFGQWREKYAKETLLGVQKTIEQQNEIRATIRENERQLDKLDAYYWSSVQSMYAKVATSSLEASPSLPQKQTRKPIRRLPRQTRATRDPGSRPGSSMSTATATRPGPRYHRSPASPAAPPDPALRTSRKAPSVKPVTRPDPLSFQGVTNAVPGGFYQAYYSSSGNDEGWYMGYVLPWDGDGWEDNISLQFSMRQIDLKTDWPSCYIPEFTRYEKSDENGNIIGTDTVVTGIKGWAPGYEDGGPLVKDRVFLFLFFDDAHRKSVQLRMPKRAGTKIKFTKAEITSGNVPIDWVPAAHLRPVEVDVGSLVRGRQTMKKFQKMLHDLDMTHRRNMNKTTEHRHAENEDNDGCHLSWDRTTLCAEEPSSIQSQVDDHQNTASEGRSHDDQASQADVISQPDPSYQMRLDGHKEEHIAKTPMIVSNMRRFSSVGVEDTLSVSDEGVIMDYDLLIEVENSAPKQSLGRETTFDGRPAQTKDNLFINASREMKFRGFSTPPLSPLMNSSFGKSRAQSVPLESIMETVP